MTGNKNSKNSKIQQGEPINAFGNNNSKIQQGEQNKRLVEFLNFSAYNILSC
ncbi:MAG: hypothetical protein RLZZ292_2433 [Bacteroidota bacterium]|jgi:hypothetical protein